MDTILEIANRRGIQVVEDNAHGLFGKYKDKYLGTFGTLAAQSFHETKNFSCGEGGALLINDPALTERAEIIREKGTNRSRFFRGQVDKYTWVDIGSSYLPSWRPSCTLNWKTVTRSSPTGNGSGKPTKPG
jgi:dTDP-4-amino-4,6-dideoxygalactose transaminase